MSEPGCASAGEIMLITGDDGDCETLVALVRFLVDVDLWQLKRDFAVSLGEQCQGTCWIDVSTFCHWLCKNGYAELMILDVAYMGEFSYRGEIQPQVRVVELPETT